MQPTTCLHDHIPNPILQEADGVLHDPVAFHSPNGLFNPPPNARDPTIRLSLRRGEFPPTRFFLGLEDRNPRAKESLEAFVLISNSRS